MAREFAKVGTDREVSPQAIIKAEAERARRRNMPSAPPRRSSPLKFSTSAAARRLRVFVYSRDDFTCRHCGYRPNVPEDYDGRLTLGTLTMDHIIPVWAGGSAYWHQENLQTLCRPCNSRKR